MRDHGGSEWALLQLANTALGHPGRALARRHRLCPFSRTPRPVIGDNGPFLRCPGSGYGLFLNACTHFVEYHPDPK
jgi:hypothetical protein